MGKRLSDSEGSASMHQIGSSHPMPPTSNTRYQLLQIILPSLVTLSLGIVGTAWFGDWFKQLFTAAPSPPTTTIERAVIYAKILYFRDRKVGEQHMIGKALQLAGGENIENEKLYDEAFYLRAYYLRTPHPDKLKFEGHSSGIIDVSPILPNSASFETHLYKQSGYQQLKYESNVQRQDYVLVAHHYYNGYQFNEKTGKYESDGGVHFSYPAEEAVVIFDFSAIDGGMPESEHRLKGAPRMWIKRPSGDRAPVETRYTNGILTSVRIENIPEGTHIYCDWEWVTEAK